MCVRLSPSHPAARIVLGLYIFLATFLIGFFVVKAVSLLSKPKLQDTEPPRDVVETPPTPATPFKVAGPVTIEYLFTEPVEQHFEVVFRITNSLPDSVHFVKDRKSCLLFEGTTPGVFISGAVTCNVEPNDLEPFQSTTLRATSFYDSPHYWLSLRYSVGSSETQQRTDIFVTHPYPDRP